MGPLQKQSGMSEIRHGEAIINAKIKREGINGYAVPVICGCSRSCGFAYIQKHTNKPITEEEKYIEWLKKNTT
jgi:DNA repair photolyase